VTTVTAILSVQDVHPQAKWMKMWLERRGTLFLKAALSPFATWIMSSESNFDLAVVF
jgi:hypothetical protein